MPESVKRFVEKMCFLNQISSLFVVLAPIPVFFQFTFVFVSVKWIGVGQSRDAIIVR